MSIDDRRRAYGALRGAGGGSVAVIGTPRSFSVQHQTGGAVRLEAERGAGPTARVVECEAGVAARIGAEHREVPTRAVAYDELLGLDDSRGRRRRSVAGGDLDRRANKQDGEGTPKPAMRDSRALSLDSSISSSRVMTNPSFGQSCRAANSQFTTFQNAARYFFLA